MCKRAMVSYYMLKVPAKLVSNCVIFQSIFRAQSNPEELINSCFILFVGRNLNNNQLKEIPLGIFDHNIKLGTL